jgi:hypothetical protein
MRQQQRESEAEPMMFGKGYKNDAFWYGPPAAVALSDTNPQGTQVIQIDAEANFEWIASSYQALIAGESVPTSSSDDAAYTHPWPIIEANNLIPPVLLQIVDTGSGKYLMNTPIPLGAFFGDGKNPYRLIAPREFGANASIQLNWTYIGPAGVTYTIYPVLHGFKKFLGR